MSQVLINEIDDECRIAIVKDGFLEELSVELKSSGQLRGNVYLATVTQVQKSLQAAFVDFGGQRNGFLSIDELNFKLYPTLSDKSGSGHSIQNHLKEGTEVLVQVIRDPSESKGAALTTFLSFPGRYMVFMPHSKGNGGVSKKVTDPEERERLKIFLEGLDTGDHSVIVRTAGIGKSLKELKSDYDSLVKLWEDIEKKVSALKAPELILEEEDPVIRIFRDYFKDDVEEIWVDNPDTFQTVFHFLKKHEPRKQKILKIYNEKRSIFNHFDIEKQIESLSGARVNLPSGGSLVIDQTEALVAVDVNSGRSTKGGNNSDMALHTNLEAAAEVARQLRLRNMGGLVVIDFIDMENRGSNKKVRDVLVQAMVGDKAQHTIGDISQFGLLEMSRQRISRGYASSIQVPCRHCQGTGRTLSENLQANMVIRRLRDLASREGSKEIQIDLPISMANLLLNEKREHLTDLENEFDIRILIHAEPGVTVLHDNLFRVSYTSEEKTGEDRQATSSNPSPKPSGRRPRKPETPPPVAEEDSASEDTLTEEKPKKFDSRKENSDEASGEQEETKENDREKKDSGRPGRKPPVSLRYPLAPRFLFKDTEEEEECIEIRNDFFDSLRGAHFEEDMRITDTKFLHTPEEEPPAKSEAKKKSGKTSPSRSTSSGRRTSGSRKSAPAKPVSEGEEKAENTTRAKKKPAAKPRKATSSTEEKSTTKPRKTASTSAGEKSETKTRKSASASTEEKSKDSKEIKGNSGTPTKKAPARKRTAPAQKSATKKKDETESQ